MKRVVLINFFFLTALMSWAQVHVEKGTPAASVNKGLSLAAHEGDDVQAQISDPLNPQVDPWDINVVRLEAGLEKGNPLLGKSSPEQRAQMRVKQTARRAMGIAPDEVQMRSSLIPDQPAVSQEWEVTYASNNSSVPDGAAAVSGQGYIVTSNNSHVAFYDEDGTELYSEGEDTFWSALNPTANIYDPRVLYHTVENRFIIVALHGSTSSLTEVFVAFSSSEDPTQPWYLYEFEGNKSTDDVWFDYPSVGFGDEDLFISGNMFDDAGDFQRCMLYQIELEDAFTGGTLSSAWWNDVEETDGDNSFAMYPVSFPFGTYGPGIYCVSIDNSTGEVYIYDIDENLSAPGLPNLTAYEVSASAFSSATNAPQSGTNDVLSTGGPRIRGAYWGGNNTIHYAHNISRNTNGDSELRYTIIDVLAATSTSSDFGLNGWDYAYPWICPWATSYASWDGGSLIGFVRVSSNTFPEFRCVHMDGSMDFGNSVQIRAGTSPITANATLGNPERWGDYLGGSRREGQNQPEVWLYGQVGQSQDHDIHLAEIVLELEGCTDPSACNYDPTAEINDGSCDYSTCAGCTASSACNYNANATLDDGSCTYPGCDDSSACNYNPAAGCSDGSCCFANCTEVFLEQYTFTPFGTEDLATLILTNLADDTQVIAVTNTFFDQTLPYCVESGCYNLEVNVSGSADWQFTFFVEGIPVSYAGSGSNSFEFSIGDEADTIGCTNPAACNYSETALCDDGSCCFANCLTIDMTDSFGDGWNNNVWEVFDPVSGAVIDSGTLDTGAQGQDLACLDAGCYGFRINTSSGLYAYEIGWTLEGADGGPVSGTYEDTEYFTVGGGGNSLACDDPLACNYDGFAYCYDNAVCCYENCLVLQMNDSFGDGWNGGALIISQDGIEIASYTLEDGLTGIAQVCLANGCYDITTIGGSFPSEITWTLTEVANGNMIGGNFPYTDSFYLNHEFGCTDPVACNYTPTATCDDGSCAFGEYWIPNELNGGPVVQACTQPEGYQSANQDCLEEIILIDPFCLVNTWDDLCQNSYDCCLGLSACIDPNACNYVTGALCGSTDLCIYPGCNDCEACNFNPDAGCDDGSCDYGCYGCTYPEASNFNAFASEDDGSCVFAVLNDCPTDLDGDGQTSSSDLLAVLGAFGSACP